MRGSTQVAARASGRGMSLTKGLVGRLSGRSRRPRSWSMASVKPVPTPPTYRRPSSDAEQQRADHAGAATGAGFPPTDDDFLHGSDLRLAPQVAAPAGQVRRVQSLADHAFEALSA